MTISIAKNRSLKCNGYRPDVIVLASGNTGKIKEIKTAFQPIEIKIIAQSELNLVEAEEIGLTFIENAILKARHAAKQSGLPAIADDSGLMVPALGNAPGIYSARYAGKKADANANIEKLLTQLEGVPKEKRAAKFCCVLVYLETELDPCPLICQATWEGSILFEPQGIHGFGYDPIFYVPSHHCSAAELSLEEKNQLSHRGKALRQLIDVFACPG